MKITSELPDARLVNVIYESFSRIKLSLRL